jgi:hypothetical protein
VGLFTPGGCQIGYTCDQNSTYGLRSLPGGVRLVTCATRTRLVGCIHSREVSDWLHVPPELDLWVALTPGGCQIGYTCHQNSTYGLHSLHSRGVSDWLHVRPELDLWVALTPGGWQIG